MLAMCHQNFIDMDQQCEFLCGGDTSGSLTTATVVLSTLTLGERGSRPWNSGTVGR